MQYASVADFLKFFPIDLTGSAEYPVPAEDQAKTKAQIGTALLTASAEVDLYVAALDLPSSVLPYLKYATCAIARKSIDLYTDRDKIRADYEDVIKNLCALAKGELKIPVARIYSGDRATGVMEVKFG